MLPINMGGKRRRFLKWVGVSSLSSLAGCEGQINTTPTAGPKQVREFTLTNHPDRTVTISATVSHADEIEQVEARYKEHLDWWGGAEGRVAHEMTRQNGERFALTIPIGEQYPGDLLSYRARDGDRITASAEAEWTDGTTRTTDVKEGHAVHHQTLNPTDISSFPYSSSTSLLIPGNQTNYREAIKHKHLITSGIKTRVEAVAPTEDKYRVRLHHSNPSNKFVNEIWGYPNSFVIALYRDQILTLERAAIDVAGRSYGLEGTQAAFDYAGLFTNPPATVTKGLYQLAKKILLDEAVEITEHMEVSPESEDVGAYRAVYINFHGDNPLMFDTVSSISTCSLELEFSTADKDVKPQVILVPSLTGQHVFQGYTNHLLEYRRQLTLDLSDLTVQPEKTTPTNNELRFMLSPVAPQDYMRSQYAPVRDHLSETLDVACSLEYSKNFSGVLEALSNGTGHIADTGPFQAALGVRTDPPKVDIVLQRYAFGTWTFASVIITRENTTIQDLTDLKGKSIAFANPTSASGSLFPLFMLKQAGLKIGEAPRSDDGADFEASWDGHSSAFEALMNGQVDAAGVGQFITWDNESDDYKQGVRELGIEDSIPRAPIVVSPELDENSKGDIVDAFLNASARMYWGEDGQEGTNDDLWFSDVREISRQAYHKVISVANELGISIELFDQEI